MKLPEPGEGRTESEGQSQSPTGRPVISQRHAANRGWEVGSTNHVGYAQVAVWVTLFGICGDPQVTRFPSMVQVTATVRRSG